MTTITVDVWYKEYQPFGKFTEIIITEADIENLAIEKALNGDNMDIIDHATIMKVTMN